jgi:hypothetical protein
MSTKAPFPHTRYVTVLWAGLLGGAILLATASPAAAVQDASCSGPSFSGIAASGNNRLAQTFTAQNSGVLTTAQLVIEETPFDSPGDYLVHINEVDASGTPTNTTLASTAIPDAAVPEGESTVTVPFASPATVVASQQYALVVTRPASSGFNVETAPTPCPGALFLSIGQSGSFTQQGETDMVFAVFVEPTPPPEPTAAKADRTLTLDANKNKVKEGKKVTLTGQLTQLGRQTECQSGQPVELQRKKPSQSAFTTFEQLQTNAAGSFSTKRKVKKTFEYRAQVPETATCGPGLSNTEKVKVKKPK